MEFTRANSQMLLFHLKKNNISIDSLQGSDDEAYKNNCQEKNIFVFKSNQNWFKTQLNNATGKEAFNYLVSQRNLNSKIINDFELGFAPNFE